MEWKRKHVKLPHKTVSGEWFVWKHVWCRPINDISTKIEYAFDPDGLETKHQKITWTEWFKKSGWDIPDDEPSIDTPDVVETVKEAFTPKSFNDALKLSLGGTTNHVKKLRQVNRPTAPPPPTAPPQRKQQPDPRVGDVAYDSKADIMVRFNGKEWIIMTAHEVRLELYRTKMNIINTTSLENTPS